MHVGLKLFFQFEPRSAPGDRRARRGCDIRFHGRHGDQIIAAGSFKRVRRPVDSDKVLRGRPDAVAPIPGGYLISSIAILLTGRSTRRTSPLGATKRAVLELEEGIAQRG